MHNLFNMNKREEFHVEKVPAKNRSPPYVNFIILYLLKSIFVHTCTVFAVE